MYTVPALIPIRKLAMTTLPVVTYPDPRLRLPTETVWEFDEALILMIMDMLDTMHNDRGVGLAAPQVGVLKKVIVVAYKRRQFALVNPEIVFAAGNELGEEGCLSIPKTRLMVPRATRIEVAAQTPNGKKIRLKERGYIARILQHEIDHLNGILIIDNGTPIPDDDRD